MTQVGELAYKVRFDARDLTKGLLSTRQQVAASKKIMQELQSPLQKYQTGLQNLADLSTRYQSVAKHQVDLSKQLERQYLEEESALRRLTKAEKSRLELLRLPDAIRARSNPAALAQQRAAERARAAEINSRAGMRQQARLTGIDDQQAAGRAALAERLARFKADRQASRDAFLERYRGSIAGESAAEHFGRFNSSGRTGGGRLSASGTAGAMSPLAFGAKAFLGAAAVKGVLDTGAAIKSLLRESTDLYTTIERTAAAFEVFTGSSARTKVLIDDMKRLSAISGVTFGSLSDGAAAMMGYGVTVDEASAKLKQMATITRGDNERFKSMALAFAQVTAAGKLMGQENLQLVNSGFAPLAEIARTTGKDMSVLRKEMEQGKITVQMVSDALTSATEAGGRYNGMLEKMAETTSGVLSKNKAAWDQAKADIGEAMAPLTELKAGISTRFAQDLSRYASLLKSASPTEAMPAADPRAEARDRAIAATQAETARRTAAEKSLADSQAEMKKGGLDSLSGMTASALQGAVSESDYEKFSRILGLLDDASKKQATADFAEYRNIQNIYEYLDKEVAAEVRKLELLDEQNKARAKALEREKQLADEGKAMAEKYASPVERLQQSLAKIEELVQSEAITKEMADRERFAAGQQYGSDVEAERRAAGQMGMSKANAAVQAAEERVAAATKARVAAQAAMPKRQTDITQNQAMERSARQSALDKAMREEMLSKGSLATAQKQMAQAALASGIEIPKTAGSLEVGGAEAAKYLAELMSPVANKDDRQITELQKQQEVMKQQLIAQRETNTRLAKLADVSPKKVR